MFVKLSIIVSLHKYWNHTAVNIMYATYYGYDTQF